MSKPYKIKEIFRSLQGEGFHSGRKAVFVRFTFCNGWTGREEDRGKGPLACSAWCDTDFVGTNGANGGRYEAVSLVSKCAEVLGDSGHRFVVLTGGEPTLQVDSWLIDVFHRWEFEVAIETNGTRPISGEVDWITVSPKPGLALFQTKGDELKLVHPQPDVDPEQFSDLAFRHFYLQPKWTGDEAERSANLKATVQYCMEHPRWRLGLQMHKAVGLP